MDRHEMSEKMNSTSNSTSYGSLDLNHTNTDLMTNGHRTEHIVSNGEAASKLPENRPTGIMGRLPVGLYYFLFTLRISLGLFMFEFVTNAISTSLARFVLYKNCLRDNHTDAYCWNSSLSDSDENSIQIESSNFMLVYKVLSTAPAVVTALIMAAVSDRRGRKLPMLLGMAGYIMSTVCLLVVTLVTQTPDYLIWIGGVLLGITGGSMCIRPNGYAILRDTIKDRRAMMLAVANLAGLSFGGGALGTYMVGPLTNWKQSYSPLYIVTACVAVTTFVYTLIVIPNSKAPPPILEEGELNQGKAEQNEKQLGIVDVFVMETRQFFGVFFRPRPKNQRKLLLIGFTIVTINFTFADGTSDLWPLLTRGSPFGWSTGDYSQFSTISSVVSFVAIFFGVGILKRLQLEDTILFVIGYFGLTVSKLLIGLSPLGPLNKDQSNAMFYTGGVISGIGWLIYPAMFAIVPRLVKRHEASRVLTGFFIVENVGPMISSVIANAIYQRTLDVYVGTAFLVLMPFPLLSFCGSLPMHMIMRRSGLAVVPASTIKKKDSASPAAEPVVTI